MNCLSSNILLTAALLLLSVVIMPDNTSAQDQNKPLLSEAILEAIDLNGIDGAKAQFSKMDQVQRKKYEIDMERISELINSYIEDGDYETSAALSEISVPFFQDMATKAMNEFAPEMAEMMAEQQQSETRQQTSNRETGNERREWEQQERIQEIQGEPRDDLERFTGLYGDPNAENSNRRLWVTVSCDGFLVSGALWGDVAPWWMQSESDNVFSFEDSFNNIRMEFPTNTGNNTMAMIHNLEFLKSPLERIGDLPNDWDSCMERAQR